MKRHLSLLLLCLAVCLGLAASSAQALGLGVYGSAGGGSAEWEADEDDGPEWDFDSDTSHAGFGFVLDTAVASRSVFNYRLNLGYDRYVDDIEDSNVELEFDGLVVDNTFGFGLVRTQAVRWWLGPQLRLAFYGGHPEDNDDYDIALWGVGLGAATGVNFHMGRLMTLGLSSGGRYVWYGGEGSSDDWDTSDADFTVTEGMVFVDLSVIFRIRDSY